jgi:lactate dehydrogenase-like 2-hydroxyacid dehydrogenase
LITPHAAFYNKESLIEMREKAALEALRVLNGENSRNPIKI